jgi:hypothetical protein
MIGVQTFDPQLELELGIFLERKSRWPAKIRGIRINFSFLLEDFTIFSQESVIITHSVQMIGVQTFNPQLELSWEFFWRENLEHLQKFGILELI